MENLKRKAIPLILTALGLSALLAAGCAGDAQFIPPALIPFEYYNCSPIEPNQLLTEYFGDHAEFRWMDVNSTYNNVVFIFKNIAVEDYMLTELDRGYIWVSQIQCNLVNPGVMDNFKLGDKIDLVGRNAGPEFQFLPKLTFNGCVVMPAGQIKLPIDSDDSLTFVPSY